MSDPAAVRSLRVDDIDYRYHSLEEASRSVSGLEVLPCSLKVLAENLLRHGEAERLSAMMAPSEGNPVEIAFRPARILMQDFTGVPAIADLAAMREAAVDLDVPVERINPLTPVDLVIDHSVMVDRFADADAFRDNVEREFERNGERYAFLHWGQKAFRNFRVVPPGTGICHQVNLEHLAEVVWVAGDEPVAYPDTLVGTDSHTTMVNGLSVLGWGVGGIEAEAAMLGHPISMLLPEVVGVRLSGRLPEGSGATDLVLAVTRRLREHGVVGKFVEFCGPGIDTLPLADRATLANMAPEYGATAGFFPVDAETLRYLAFTGRDPHRIRLVEHYAKAQGLWREPDAPEPRFSAVVDLDLGSIEPSLAGPKRPQDRVPLGDVASTMASLSRAGSPGVPVAGTDHDLRDGDVVIAAITSCTNTSNPSAMVAAGLVARKACERGLTRKPWVKTSLAPGSQVVTAYLEAAGLTQPLEQLGFHLVGYGCTTCIGNSGPLDPAIVEAIESGDKLTVCSVLSGNRNFEGRVHPHVRANWLASPALVVAYALAGSLRVDLVQDSLGTDAHGNEVFLHDLCPSNAEVADAVAEAVRPSMFRACYDDVFEGPEAWRRIRSGDGATYAWQAGSTYVRRPPFFDSMDPDPVPPRDILGARALLVLGDSITTDHVSPAGAIREDSPAGEWLREHQVRVRDFNSYGSRRGNHEVMIRGTFGNVRIRNRIAPGTEGGVTRHMPDGQVMSVFDAAERYRADDVPLIVIAGREYGTGSSRDWAAKGTRLLGIRAVIAESFERIHRTNLVGMGVLPLVFREGTVPEDLDGTETFDIVGLEEGLSPRMDLELRLHRPGRKVETLELVCRIDTADEADYYRNDGILPHVLLQLARQAGAGG